MKCACGMNQQRLMSKAIAEDWKVICNHCGQEIIVPKAVIVYVCDTEIDKELIHVLLLKSRISCIVCQNEIDIVFKPCAYEVTDQLFIQERGKWNGL